MNGYNSLHDEDCFLFTSESVGEGHPGELCCRFLAVPEGVGSESAGVLVLFCVILANS